jgi:Zn-finger nucleic acid-binding protein
MIVVEFQGVEVDHCLDCRGTWFDAGELELIVELAGCERSGLEEALATGGRQTAGQRRCPRCRARMHAWRTGEPPIELDRCPDGEGIWLDAGELAAVVRAYANEGELAMSEFFGDLFRHELSGRAEER